MEWYYSDEGNQVGPIDEGEFNNLVEGGKISANTLVWHTEMTDWQEYGKIEGTAPADISAEASGVQQTDSPPVAEQMCSECGNSFSRDDMIAYENTWVCAACKPLFVQKLKEGVPVSGRASSQYGSIEKGLNGDYSFTISDILSEAWGLTKGCKLPIVGASVVMYIIIGVLSVAVGTVTGLFSNIFSNAFIDVILQVFNQLVIALVTYPIMAGIMMIGINRSVDRPVSFSSAFSYFNRIIPLLVTYILMTIFILVGFVLLIIPGIYLAVSYVLAIPLIVEKDLKPLEALETSRKALTNRWFSVFGLMLLLWLILGISAIPLGIGLIWTVPLAVIATGILYRNVFGVE